MRVNKVDYSLRIHVIEGLGACHVQRTRRAGYVLVLRICCCTQPAISYVTNGSGGQEGMDDQNAPYVLCALLFDQFVGLRSLLNKHTVH